MSKSKRYVENQKQVDREAFYTPHAAIKAIKGMSQAKFDESIECHFRSVSYTHLTLPTICSV